jgi:hypothetical protein
VNTAFAPALILCERTGRWATSLRRHRLGERLPIVETRSLAELEEALRERPRALAGVELTATIETQVVEFLCHPPAGIDPFGFIVFAQPELRSYEPICREAGAVHFITSELDLLSLPPVLDRYLSDPAFAKLNSEGVPPSERIRARMPWST